MEDNSQKNQKMEIYIEMLVRILKEHPHFIKTIPKEMALKLIFVIALNPENNSLLETLILNLCDKFGKEFLEEVESVVDNPDNLFKND